MHMSTGSSPATSSSTSELLRDKASPPPLLRIYPSALTKKQVLVRDDYRCVLTGKLDKDAISDGIIEWDGRTDTGALQLTRIISPSRSLDSGIGGMTNDARAKVLKLQSCFIAANTTA